MKTKKLSVPYLLWLAIFVVVPLVFVVYFAFQGKNGFSFENYVTAAKYLPTLGKSLVYALECTILCLLMAYPTAYIFSRMRTDRQKTMLLLIMLPMWMNFLLRIYSLTIILEKNGIVNKILGLVGLGPFNMMNTDGAVLLGMVYNFLPFMILPLYSVMSKIDGRLLEASADLGAGGLTTLRRVVFPLSFPGIVTGIIMVFIPAASTFVISQRLGDGSMLIGDLIETFFIGAYTNFGVGSAISLVLMVLMLIFIGVLNLFDNEDVGDMLI
ncbi:MAG: ABC transporter permease [Clostridia bacterium]|nr:ABC transporter permease [Clostridia bacterium]